MIHPKLEKKIKRIRNTFQQSRFLNKILPLVLGVLALLWFLIRVVPKPQRAAYPCMKAAYPFMSGLVAWLLGITGLTASARLFLNKLRRKKYLLAVVPLFVFAAFYVFISVSQSGKLSANNEKANPVHIANSPFGTPQGILPGRVVWAWNPDATNENCTNDLQNNDGYILPKNNNQQVIDKMVAESILKLSGAKSPKKAWDKLFKHFNTEKRKGNNGYRNTETVFIKINQGHASVVEPDLTRRSNDSIVTETSPQIVLSVLKQLVNVAGVPQNKIIVADPMSHIHQDIYTFLHNEYPDVNYGDKDVDAIALGRMLLHADTVPAIYYADKGTILRRHIKTECLYKEMVDADYMINIAALKAHACAGVSLCAKNHFGSLTRKNAGHFHTALVGPGNDRPQRVDYGMYRVQVDLMGSKYLGRNTMLFMVDGLWGGPEALAVPLKWVMQPFNNDWPSSVFVSLDPVAIESVCFDFLRYEAKIGSPAWKNRPNFAQGVDDYLHQAASSEYWPEGMSYDPDNCGTPIPSLGVHEHWNNPIDKNYTGNMGNPGGIELVRVFTKEK